MMNPILLQKQIRDNASDLQDFCKELKQWGDEMKRKEEGVQGTNNEPMPKAKMKKIASKERPKKVAKPKSYRDWEKFDVEAECKKIDRDDRNDSDSVESDLTDEYDESTRDEALLEKEKGNKFVKNQRWDNAIDCYTKAIGFYAYDPVFYANRALCYLKKESFKNAEVDCTTALQLDKTYVKAYQRRAAAREALGQLSEAHSDLLKVFDYEPNNKESKQTLAKLEKKLENIPKQSVCKDVQKPVSKFTLSRQKKKQTETITDLKTNEKCTTEFNLIKSKVVERREDKKIAAPLNKTIDENRHTFWSGNDDVILIKDISKRPHLRSKKPLRRIVINDIDTTTAFLSPQKNETLQNKKVASEHYNKKVCKLPKEPHDFPVPKTSVQFYSHWKQIGDKPDLKLMYLLRIPPKDFRNIFYESLSSDVFSEILETLAEMFVKENKPVYEYLEGLSYVKRFVALVMFMSTNDKNAILKLTDFMRNEEGRSKDEIDALLVKYSTG